MKRGQGVRSGGGKGTRTKESPLVYLRHPVELDRGEYLALRRASRAFLEPWDCTPPGRRINPHDDAAFDRYLGNARLESSLRFLVCEAGSGAIAGHIGISNVVRGCFQSCTVGYWIGSGFTRRGYMSDALAIVLHFAFRRLKLHRVEANIVPTNRASTGLVKSLGFRFEGVGRRYLRINGAWQDHGRWGMTVEDFGPLCEAGRIPFSAAVARRFCVV